MFIIVSMNSVKLISDKYTCLLAMQFKNMNALLYTIMILLPKVICSENFVYIIVYSYMYKNIINKNDNQVRLCIAMCSSCGNYLIIFRLCLQVMSTDFCRHSPAAICHNYHSLLVNIFICWEESQQPYAYFAWLMLSQISAWMVLLESYKY